MLDNVIHAMSEYVAGTTGHRDPEYSFSDDWLQSWRSANFFGELEVCEREIREKKITTLHLRMRMKQNEAKRATGSLKLVNGPSAVRAQAGADQCQASS